VGGACGTHGRGKCKRFWWESPKEKDHLEDRGVDGRIGSEWVFRILAETVWNGFRWVWMGPAADCCEHGGELSSSSAT
jgi:hypothetical protein